MSQTTPVVPTTGIVSGLAMANAINAALATLNTCWLGSSAPSDAPNGIPANGQFWIDTSVAGYQLIKKYDGSAWIIEGVIDTTNDLFLNPLGGGTATIASASTTDLGSKYEAYQTISGTTTITAFGSNVPRGQMKILTFSGSLILTHNATSLILPGGANITTANGDAAIMMSLGSGNWKCIFYGRISGAQLSMTGSAGSVASATTTDLASAGANAVTVTGTTTITSFGSNATTANPYYFVRFTGALILTHNGTSLIIPGAQNITTSAGDWLVAEYLGSGNWRVDQYQRSDGRSISVVGTDTSIASAGTTNLGSLATNIANITGTTTITSFGSSASVANPIYFLRFTGALTLTHNATSLILPGGANITTANGDAAIAQYLGSGNWKVLSYDKINGSSVVSGGTPTITWLTTGSGTYNTPANARALKIRMVGGGGGSGGSGTSGGSGGGTGGATTFGSLTCNGGVGSAVATTISSTGGAGGTATGGDMNWSGQQGGTNWNNSATTDGQGPAGGSSVLFYGPGNSIKGGSSPQASMAGIANTGGGASGTGGNSNVGSSGGGGGGGALEKLITSPSATYSYAVGAGGTAGTAGTSGTAGAAGGSGVICVEALF